MEEREAYISFIVRMIERMDMRRIKLIYEFTLALTR